MPVDDHEFGAFFISHYGRLYALGVLLTGDRGQAEELAQDALVRTYRRWALVGPPDDPASFARRVLINRHRSLLRRGVVEARQLLRLRPDAQPVVDQPEDAMVMWAAVRQLPSRQRAVIVLRYYEDLSEAEVARLLGLPLGTVKSLGRRGLGRLRRRLTAPSGLGGRQARETTVNVEEQVRVALESVALATRPEERGAYQRFLRRRARRARMEAAGAAVLLLVLLAGAVVLPSQLRRPPVMAGATGSPTVDVTAFQWGWRFAYAGTHVRVNGGLGRTPELVVPAGQAVHVRLRSDDIVHSFSVPSLRFERQAFPGRVTEFDLTVAEVGTYSGRCGTYCGLAHTEMPFLIRAMPREEFSRWLQSTAKAAVAPITLEGRLLTGGSWSSATTRDKLLVVAVTASWCGPCRSGQGSLNDVADAYQAMGVRFLAVATQDTKARALAFARTSHITFPVLLDPSGTIAQRLQVTVIPVTFVLDRDGRIAARLEGQSARRTLSAHLDSLLSGKAANQPP